MKNTVLVSAVIGFCLTVLMVNVFAWGVVHENNHITMEKGEIKHFYTSLQNMVGNDSYDVEVSIVNGEEVASLSQTRYALPPNTNRLPVYINISIPSDTNRESYDINLIYSLSNSNNDGQVGLRMEKTIALHIDIADDELPPLPNGNEESPPSGGSPTSHEPEEPEPEPEESEPIIEPDIHYPVQEQPSDSQQPDTEESDNSYADSSFESVVAEGTGIPARIPIEWILFIIALALIGYMLLPPKKKKPESANQIPSVPRFSYMV